MASILPVPTGRTSELLVRQRLMSQLNGSQVDLLKLETQISSGQRLLLPSDDAPAAMRALSLQQLLNRKDQLKTNLSTSQSFLSATDSALAQVANLLSNVRGTALAVTGDTATASQRATAADQVRQALEQLVNTANTQFRGRYLFGGSRTDQIPFQLSSQSVSYSGNEVPVSTFVDTNLLLQTNADGNSVFGAISTPAGSANLNPSLNENTPLSSLNGGLGIDKSSIAISDGASTRVVDLSKANTVGDVMRLIESQPPAGRTITVALDGDRLNVSLDPSGGGQLSINEVGSGKSAKGLGIVQAVGVDPGPVVGKSLDPRITNGTELADLLGARAQVTLVSPGSGNDIKLQAVANGTQYNGIAVSFVNNNAINPGQEQITFDPQTNQLVIQINAGASTAKNVIDSINNDPVAQQIFHASLSQDDVGLNTDPQANFVSASAAGTSTSGSGAAFDQQAGLLISSNGQTYAIDLSHARTVEDMLNEINSSPAGALAEINSQGTGISIRSRVSGVDFSIGENGGQTATQLGVRTLTTETTLASLNHGLGVHALGTGPDFVIQRKDGIELKIDVSSAKTVGDVINLINNHPANLDPDHAVTARLNAVGNGIELTTNEVATIAPLAVKTLNNSQAASDLGLVPIGATTSNPAGSSGPADTLTGRDTGPSEVSGVFSALLRLEQALRANDTAGIQRSLDMLSAGNYQVTAARADLGVRQQGLDTLQDGLTSEVNMLKSSLSDEVDTDLPSAISDLAGRQSAFQAALQTAATISKMTLLDFL